MKKNLILFSFLVFILIAIVVNNEKYKKNSRNIDNICNYYLEKIGQNFNEIHNNIYLKNDIIYTTYHTYYQNGYEVHSYMNYAYGLSFSFSKFSCNVFVLNGKVINIDRINSTKQY